MVKVNINFKRKDLFLVSAIFVFLIGVGFVIAYNSSPANPAVMGHSYNEIQTCGANQILKMNTAGTAWICGEDSGADQVCETTYSKSLIATRGSTGSSSSVSYSAQATRDIKISAAGSYDGSPLNTYAYAGTTNPPTTLKGSDSDSDHGPFTHTSTTINMVQVNSGQYYLVDSTRGVLNVYEEVPNTVCYQRYSRCSWENTQCEYPVSGYFGYICANGGVLKGIRFRDSNTNCVNDLVSGVGGDPTQMRHVEIYCCY